MNETCKRGAFRTASRACHQLTGIRVLDPRLPGKEVEQSWLEVLRSANDDRILGAEGGQIGGGVLAAAAPPCTLCCPSHCSICRETIYNQRKILFDAISPPVTHHS